MEYKYFVYKVRMLNLIIIILGCINIAFSQFNYDFIKLLNDTIKNWFNKDLNLNYYLYVLLGISAIILALNKYTWLPFLGESVFPSALVPLNPNVKGDTSVIVKVKPNTKVAYWSALPNNTDKTPYVTDAYGNYSNSGVVLSDDNGEAILIFNQGSGYKVPTGKYIKPHVHYRELNKTWGMMGPVKTVFL